MRNHARRVFALIGCLAFCACAAGPQGTSSSTPQTEWQVSPTAVGSFHLGMTVMQARAALASGYHLMDPPNRTLRTGKHQSDPKEEEIGGPVLLISNDQFSVRDSAGNKIMEFLLADSAKPDAPGNRIVMISASDSRFSTREGVQPGDGIVEAAKVYGTPSLVNDDEEGFGREWIVFQKAPAGIRFQASGPAGDGRWAGIYDAADSTTSFVSGSKIRALIIGWR